MLFSVKISERGRFDIVLSGFFVGQFKPIQHSVRSINLLFLLKTLNRYLLAMVCCNEFKRHIKFTSELSTSMNTFNCSKLTKVNKSKVLSPENKKK